MYRQWIVGVLIGLIATPLATQGQLVPLSEDVEQKLLPGGITSMDAHLSAELAYLFKDSDGTDTIHLIGNFSLTLGDGQGQEIFSNEAVVWINHRTINGQAYLHLQLMLFGDVEVRELGGTHTSGPALFVTLNTSGRLKTHIDDVAFESSTNTSLYQEGNAIRLLINERSQSATDQNVFQQIYDLSGFSTSPPQAKLRPLIHLRVEGQLSITAKADGGQVMTATGGVFLSRSGSEAGAHLEINAESVVIFLPASAAEPGKDYPSEAGLGGNTQSRPQNKRKKDTSPQQSPDNQLLATGFGDLSVEAAYLEGDVVMRQGPHMIRANRLYYDFLRDRAIILDAVLRTPLAERNLPLYIRAAEIRQLSRQHFSANDALLTTSEFHTPHYHLGADRIEIINRTPLNMQSGRGAVRSGLFNLRNVTLNIGGYPIAYVPVIKGRLDTSETGVKSARTGFSGDFGVEVETDWHLFHLLGYEQPEGFDATLSLDYFSKRGPAAGIDVDYKQNNYFGKIRSYLLGDRDQDNLGRERRSQSARDVRGRMLIRHRQQLPDHWEVSLEFSYLSDRDFLEEFFEPEFDNDKEQETLLYIKKQVDNRAFTALLQTRLMDFLTQTDRAPEIALYVIGDALNHNTTWYSENRAGFERYRPADPTFLEFLIAGHQQASGMVGRIDSRQEFDTIIDVGPVRLVPFVTFRGTAWDDSPDSGGLTRAFGTVGLRGSLFLTHTDPDIRSEMFNINGVRHIIKTDFVAWASESNRDRDELFPFDESVERIRDADGVLVGLRQRWQTKRGQDDNRRIVDYLTLDVEAGVFNNHDGETITNGFTSFSRPENSLVRNFVNGSLIWRINDRTALLGEVNYDMNDGEVDVLNISLSVERPPRLSYLIGYRFIEESNSELFGFDLNYQLTEKHTLAIRELFDINRGRSLDFTVALIRRFPRWFGAISFALDEPEDDFGVSLSIWPEGLPNATLGSRRFTGLSRSTRLYRN